MNKILINSVFFLLCTGVVFSQQKQWQMIDYVSFYKKITLVDSTELFLLPSLTNKDSSDFIAFSDTNNFQGFLVTSSSSQEQLRKIMLLFPIVSPIFNRYYDSDLLDEKWKISSFLFLYERTIMDVLTASGNEEKIQRLIDGGGIYTSLNGVLNVVKTEKVFYTDKELITKINSISNVYNQLVKKYTSKKQKKDLLNNLKLLLKSNSFSKELEGALKQLLSK